MREKKSAEEPEKAPGGEREDHLETLVDIMDDQT